MNGNIYEIDGVITGELTPIDEVITGELKVLDDVITGSITVQLSPEDYTGEYDVIPKINPQQLYTANKSMKKDVTVWGIPNTEVSNPYGTTFIVGDE